jgi:hypothetical protein
MGTGTAFGDGPKNSVAIEAIAVMLVNPKDQNGNPG